MSNFSIPDGASFDIQLFSFDDVPPGDEGVRSVWEAAAIFVLLISFSVGTVVGNGVVIVAVAREEFLHSPTNFLIASLAVADFLLGLLVMPLEALTELLGRRWVFGGVACDVWRAADVLLATASILHLCVISLDRYWAISSPFSYPRRMTPRTASLLIGGVWLLSSALSLPFIAYWEARRDGGPLPPPGQCFFTDDALYLLGSSALSFYVPLLVMLFTYFKIYRAAIRQKRSIKLGVKLLQDSPGELKLLRIHRGGSLCPSSSHQPPRRKLSRFLPAWMRRGRRGDEEEEFDGDIASATVMTTVSMALYPGMRVKGPTRGSIVRRKLSKFGREKKAAKTLAIVLGVFILCWLPFFTLNVAAGVCPACRLHDGLLFSVVTWLGWVNSSMNPVIYAARNPDFRRAFGRVFCFSPCCNKFQV